MIAPAPEFAKDPWKHPAVLKHHLVKTVHGNVEGVGVSISSCECGWIACSRHTFAGHLALTEAINGHWLGVITESEAEGVAA